MARPIRETPILYGKNAERFMENMRRVDSMSIEERKENTRKAREACKGFITEIIYARDRE